MRASTIVLVLALLVAAPVVASCIGGGGNGGSALDVRWSEEAVLVPADEVEEGLLDADRETGAYRFRAGTGGVDELEVGDVAVLGGLALRRVVGIDRPEGEIVVLETEPATLDEAVVDGNIHWRRQLDFTGSTTADLTGLEVWWGDVALASDLAVEDSTLSFSGNVRGFDVEVKLTPEPGKLNVELVGKKKGIAKTQSQTTLMDLFLPVVPLGENTVEASERDVLVVTAKGWISGLSSNADIDYVGGELQSFAYQNEGLESHIELKFAAISGASTLQTGVELLRLPIKFNFPPILVGGWLPVRLSVGATPRITAAVTSPNASSRGAFEVEYGGDQGFNFSSGVVETAANLHSSSLDISPDATISAGQMTTAFSFGLEFPRFEVRMFDEVVVPYLTVDTYGESYYEPGILSKRKACQRGELHNRSVAGINFSFLGFEHQTEKELWKREIADGSECE